MINELYLMINELYLMINELYLMSNDSRHTLLLTQTTARTP